MHTWFWRKHVIKLPISQPLTVQQLRTFLTVFAAKAAPAADVGRGGRRAGGGRGWSCWGSSASGEWRDLVGAWAAQKNILNLGFIMVLHLGLKSKDLWNQQHRNRAGWLCTEGGFTTAKVCRQAQLWGCARLQGHMLQKNYDKLLGTSALASKMAMFNLQFSSSQR